MNWDVMVLAIIVSVCFALVGFMVGGRLDRAEARLANLEKAERSDENT